MGIKGIGVSILAGVVGLFILMASFGGYYTVQEQERGVLTHFGQFEQVAGPGFHLKNPFSESVTKINVGIKSVSNKDPINTYTIDNQEIDATFRVFYRIPPDQVEYVYRNVPDAENKLFNMAIDRFKVETGKINVQTFAEKRGELRDHIKEVLGKDAKTLGVEVTDFQIPNADYSKSFRLAVETAASAKANVETQEQLQRQEEIKAHTAKIIAIGEADKAREAARGAADAALLQAEANAKAIKLNGEAQAAALEAQNKALQQNTSLIELEKAKRWNGALPTQMLGNVVPFMSVK